MTPLPVFPDTEMPGQDEEEQDGGVKLSGDQWNAIKATMAIVRNYLETNLTRCGVVEPKPDGKVQ